MDVIESEDEDITFDKLEHKVKDSNGKEYLILFQALSDKIEITCTLLEDEEIFYNTNVNFVDVKNKHKYLKGAENSEEILEALNEFVDSIKISQEGNKMKIILKKKIELFLNLLKKSFFLMMKMMMIMMKIVKRKY